MDVIPDNLTKPLYLFNLPQDVLETLAPKIIDPLQEVEKEDGKKETKGEPQSDNQPSVTKGTSCSLCGLSFDGSAEQRQHVKSDLHRYNLKRKIKGQTPVSEADFDRMIGELDESISGSESSESESDGDGEKDDILTSLLKRQAKLSSPEEPEPAKPRKMTPGNPPLIWLTTANAPDNVVLGVYRSLFTPAEQTDVVASIQKKQLKPIQQAKPQPNQTINDANPAYFLCMIGGGHFAAMVVALAPKHVAKHNATTERQAIVLAHKTFHRYTTRRKQGGAQSASDAAKGAAHSAGSSLRRANEAALSAEVRALLTGWRAMIEGCELLFVRATGTANRRTLYGPYEGQVLRSGDPRSRTFPFTTRRATQAELVRAFGELTRVKVRLLDDVAAPNPAPAAAPPRPTAPAPKPKPKRSRPPPRRPPRATRRSSRRWSAAPGSPPCSPTSPPTAWTRAPSPSRPPTPTAARRRRCTSPPRSRPRARRARAARARRRRPVGAQRRRPHARAGGGRAGGAGRVPGGAVRHGGAAGVGDRRRRRGRGRGRRGRRGTPRAWARRWAPPRRPSGTPPSGRRRSGRRRRRRGRRRAEAERLRAEDAGRSEARRAQGRRRGQGARRGRRRPAADGGGEARAGGAGDEPRGAGGSWSGRGGRGRRRSGSGGWGPVVGS